jgi:hypothetical protein
MPLPRFSIRWMFGFTAVCAVVLLVLVRAGKVGEALAVGGTVALGFAGLTLLIHALCFWLFQRAARIFPPRTPTSSPPNTATGFSAAEGESP